MYEHGVLKRVLLVYEAALTHVDDDLPLAASSLMGGATIIHDFIEGFHEALEEGYVFPALRAAGQLVPTVDTLLLQHGRGRLITQLLLGNATTAKLSSTATRTRVVAATAAFVRMYQPHEAREDTVVFPTFRALLGPARLEDVGATFTSLQDQQFGPGGFTSAVDSVAALEVPLGINQLADFTPEAVDPSA
jgi:hemerythrin-like domain-containing protein